MAKHSDIDAWLAQIGVEYKKTVNDENNEFTWSFMWGSATIHCRLFGLEPTRNLFAWATVLDNVNRIPEINRCQFYRLLLELNSKSWNYVKFAITKEGDVQLRWGILARHLDDKDEFILGMTQIAKTADQYDDEFQKYCQKC